MELEELLIINGVQVTSVNEVNSLNLSHSKSITCGVRQGSILGPLFYLIYVNDIHKSCNSNILSFADDTTLFLSSSDIESFYKEANKEINSSYMWFCANKLSLNAKKTTYIILRPHSKKCSVENRKLIIDWYLLNELGMTVSQIPLNNQYTII